jgi:hypothetical protein
MERCMHMPHVAGKRVTLDALLIETKARTYHIAAIYTSSSTHGYPDIHETHFVLESDDSLVEYDPPGLTEWALFDWCVAPNGSVDLI